MLLSGESINIVTIVPLLINDRQVATISKSGLSLLMAPKHCTTIRVQQVSSLSDNMGRQTSDEI